MNDEQEVVRLYLEGESIRRLSDEYGTTPQGVWQLLRRNNIDIRDQRKTTDEQEEQLIAEYLDGGTLDTVSENWGIERTTVQHILIRHGVDRHPCSVPTHVLDEHIFDCIDNEVSAYLLGQVYADGCVMMDKATLSIGLSEKDHDYLEMLRGLYGTDFDIKVSSVKNYRGGKNTDACRLSMYSRHMAQTLFDLGIVARRGKFCNTLPKMHPSVYNHFIRGFYDGDGSIDCRTASNRITPHLRVRFLGQVDILSWIRDLLADELGTSRNKKISQKPGIMGIEYCGGIVGYKVASWIYNDATICMKRKHDKYIEYKKIRGW
jgi:transposase-like protein